MRNLKLCVTYVLINMLINVLINRFLTSVFVLVSEIVFSRYNGLTIICLIASLMN